MVQGGFDTLKRAKTEGFSHSEFGFEVQTLNGTGRNLSMRREPVHQKLLVFP